MPRTWNWFDTFGVMVAGSWLFAYSYCITFIAGEVKRPDKTIILSNLFAIIVPGVFMLWAAISLYGLVKFDFFSATQFVDNAGSDLGGAYTVPWSTNFLGLLAMIGPAVTRSSCSSRCCRSSRSTCGGSPCLTWPSRASSSRGAWTAWARSGSRTSTRASRAR